MLRYTVGEASAANGGVPPPVQRALVLSCVHGWVVRGQAKLNVASLSAALSSSSSSTSTSSSQQHLEGDSSETSAMDASNRMADLLSLVEEMMLFAMPWAYAIHEPSGVTGIATLSALPPADTSESLDLLANYVDIHNALGAITALGVGCEVVHVPTALRDRFGASVTTLPPLGHVKGCDTLIALSSARAGVFVMSMLSQSVRQRVPLLWGEASFGVGAAEVGGSSSDGEVRVQKLTRALGSLSAFSVELAAVAATGRLPIPPAVERLVGACAGAIAGDCAELVASSSSTECVRWGGMGAIICDQAAALCESMTVRAAFGTGHSLRQQYFCASSRAQAWALVQERCPDAAQAVEAARRGLRAAAAATAAAESENCAPKGQAELGTGARAPLSAL